MLRTSLRLILWATLVALLVPAGHAQTRRAPTLDDMLDLVQVSSPQISPDGTRLLYTVRDGIQPRRALVVHRRHTMGEPGWLPPAVVLHAHSEGEDADHRHPRRAGHDRHDRAGEMFYQGLKDRGVPVRFLRSPREPHGFRQPHHQRTRDAEEISWLMKHARGIDWTAPPRKGEEKTDANSGTNPGRR